MISENFLPLSSIFLYFKMVLTKNRWCIKMIAWRNPNGTFLSSWKHAKVSTNALGYVTGHFLWFFFNFSSYAALGVALTSQCSLVIFTLLPKAPNIMSIIDLLLFIILIVKFTRILKSCLLIWKFYEFTIDIFGTIHSLKGIEAFVFIFFPPRKKVKLILVRKSQDACSALSFILRFTNNI